MGKSAGTSKLLFRSVPMPRTDARVLPFEVAPYVMLKYWTQVCSLNGALKARVCLATKFLRCMYVCNRHSVP